MGNSLILNSCDVFGLENKTTYVSSEDILNTVSQEKIMEHYLGIPVRRGLVKSPLRDDTNPTCSFYKKNSTLFFKDFSGSFHGNCFSVVKQMFNCDFKTAIKIIANDFNIEKDSNIAINPPKIKYTEKTLETTTTSEIQVKVREFSKVDIDFWASFGINKDILKKFKIFSIESYWINKKMFTRKNDKQKIFGYFGGVKEGIERWRLYFPGNRRYKFVSNWSRTQIQGIETIRGLKDNLLCVTKSMKDCMVLNRFNIPSISPISENLFLDKKQYEQLKKKFDKIVLFYDNDLAGISNMNKIRKQYPEVIVTYLPRNSKTKDISDYYRAYGEEKTSLLIDEYIYHLNKK